ncbi:asparagine--tRNA ligase [Flavobacteriaceae bacterium]|nr:asparagine--tRNA ligase [Flavobacteriaceae bacterium]MDA8704078.1 asparagine--tRNA ligase [Flavobacteriaceae bacterium]MDA9192620.1 asparagine--tRNA ligase [Flavobacteriaceae bacterium]MDA9850867.1 asparagine--tRNA ligase [Flavobacteriaceae bacterium]MDB3883797.1 asparagine--tRNA ligase [Flavobacteriaceae bacterium]
MDLVKIKDIFTSPDINKNITIGGWVRAFRAKKFIELNDGSSIKNIQCVISDSSIDEKILKKISIGSSLKIKGDLIKSIGKGQNFEIQILSIELLGESDPDKYPIQPKKHSFEFLREQAHLRIRTSTFSSVMRIRSKLAFGIHDFFNKKDFNYINTPIITSNDAEGAGEMFKVTTLSEDQIDKKETDYSKDFFGKRTSLTVSGQLEAETYALGLGNVYTFGPTFRAENSNTSRHASEFWMIEPEMAFYDLNDNMDLAESFLKNILQYILDNCSEDLNFLDERLTKEESQKPKIERSDLTLIEKIKFTIDNKFVRISYTEAFEILRNSNYNKKKKFKYLLDEWGCDFQSEHERFLVEKHFKSPVIIYDYPTKIKAFYMRLNDDEKTVRAMDVLFPGIGEIIGGSQREERLDVLKNRMNEMDIDEKELWWYLDLRRYGTVPHSGFGLGFERIVMFCTGMQNIRDVIPYPRTPKNASF